MKIAIPVWNGRVSPVLDVARTLAVYEVGAGSGASHISRRVRSGKAVDAVIELGVERVVCSAISASAETALRLAGVPVVAGICGPVEAIVAALAAGDTELAGFRAPGLRRPSAQRPQRVRIFRSKGA